MKDRKENEQSKNPAEESEKTFILDLDEYCKLLKNSSIEHLDFSQVTHLDFSQHKIVDKQAAFQHDKSLKLHSNVTHIQALEDGLLALAYENGALEVRNINTAQVDTLRQSEKNCKENQISTLTSLPSNALAISTTDGYIHIWNVEAKKTIFENLNVSRLPPSKDSKNHPKIYFHDQYKDKWKDESSIGYIGTYGGYRANSIVAITSGLKKDSLIYGTRSGKIAQVDWSSSQPSVTPIFTAYTHESLLALATIPETSHLVSFHSYRPTSIGDPRQIAGVLTIWDTQNQNALWHKSIGNDFFIKRGITDRNKISILSNYRIGILGEYRTDIFNILDKKLDYSLVIDEEDRASQFAILPNEDLIRIYLKEYGHTEISLRHKNKRNSYEESKHSCEKIPEWSRVWNHKAFTVLSDGRLVYISNTDKDFAIEVVKQPLKNITQSDMEPLFKLLQSPLFLRKFNVQLHTLNLQHCKMTTAFPIIQLLKHNKNITKIDLRNTDLGLKNAIEILSELKVPSKLEILNEDVERLFKAYVKKDKQAQYSLGEIYSTDKTQDDELAFNWYEQAAEQKHAGAEYKLAKCYESGKGTQKDEKAAFKWYQNAAEHKHAQAQAALAQYYEKGTATPKDDKQSAIWYQNAANQGIAQAQSKLAQYYFEGKGVVKNSKEALKWCELAAKQGDNTSKMNLRTYQEANMSLSDAMQELSVYHLETIDSYINKKTVRFLTAVMSDVKLEDRPLGDYFKNNVKKVIIKLSKEIEKKISLVTNKFNVLPHVTILKEAKSTLTKFQSRIKRDHLILQHEDSNYDEKDFDLVSLQKKHQDQFYKENHFKKREDEESGLIQNYESWWLKNSSLHESIELEIARRNVVFHVLYEKATKYIAKKEHRLPSLQLLLEEIPQLQSQLDQALQNSEKASASQKLDQELPNLTQDFPSQNLNISSVLTPGVEILVKAISSNEARKVERILRQTQVDINCFLDQLLEQEMWTPLHLACQMGNAVIVEQLLKLKPLLDVEDFHGNTPLHLAVINHHHEIILLLLKSRASFTIINDDNTTAMDLILLEGNRELLQKIEKLGITIPRNPPNSAPKLSENKFSFTEKLSERNLEKFSELTVFRKMLEKIRQKNTAEFKTCISEHKNMNPDCDLGFLEESLKGIFLLHFICEFGTKEMLSFVMQLNPNLDIQNQQKETPLHRAVLLNRIEMVEVLLDFGANSTLRNNENKTAAQLADEKSYAAISKLIHTSQEENGKWIKTHPFTSTTTSCSASNNRKDTKVSPISIFTTAGKTNQGAGQKTTTVQFKL